MGNPKTQKKEEMEKQQEEENAVLPTATGCPGQNQVAPGSEDPFRRGGAVGRSPKKNDVQPGTAAPAMVPATDLTDTQDVEMSEDQEKATESIATRVDLASKIRAMKGSKTLSHQAGKSSSGARKRAREGTPEPEEAEARSATTKKQLADLTIIIREKLRSQVKNRAEKTKELAHRNTASNVKTLTEEIIGAATILGKDITSLVTNFLEEILENGGNMRASQQDEREELVRTIEEQEDLLQETVAQLQEARDKIAELENTISAMRAERQETELAPVVSKEDREQAMATEIAGLARFWQVQDLEPLGALKERQWPYRDIKKTFFTKAGMSQSEDRWNHITRKANEIAKQMRRKEQLEREKKEADRAGRSSNERSNV